LIDGLDLNFRPMDYVPAVILVTKL